MVLTNALSIAGRYAYLRKQFSADMGKNAEEQPIINYPTTQVRILPALAESFAIRFAAIKTFLMSNDVSVNFIYF